MALAKSIKQLEIELDQNPNDKEVERQLVELYLKNGDNRDLSRYLKNRSFLINPQNWLENFSTTHSLFSKTNTLNDDLNDKAKKYYLSV